MSIHLDDLYFGKVGLGEQELRSKLTLELAMHSAQQTQCMSPWACVTVAYFSAWLSIAFLKRGQNTHTHTHTHTHTNTYTHTHIHTCARLAPAHAGAWPPPGTHTYNTRTSLLACFFNYTGKNTHRHTASKQTKQIAWTPRGPQVTPDLDSQGHAHTEQELGYRREVRHTRTHRPARPLWLPARPPAAAALHPATPHIHT